MLNEALKLVRKFHRLNQKELASKIEISRSYLSEIESGKKKPNIELLERYSKVFDIKPSSLLLFSEQLNENNFVEKSRLVLAKKVIKIMNWLADSEQVKNSAKIK